jgi:hypothetical protein
MDTNGRYIGMVSILWTFPASAMLLIILPKVLALRAANRVVSRPNPRASLATGNVRINGVPTDSSFSKLSLEDLMSSNSNLSLRQEEMAP